MRLVNERESALDDDRDSVVEREIERERSGARRRGVATPSLKPQPAKGTLYDVVAISFSRLLIDTCFYISGGDCDDCRRRSYGLYDYLLFFAFSFFLFFP
uniref:Uncharacterized protein n=1 Tax=Opuntia streptacantha TaxID=393608 RepID=A0A7C9DVN6_OPUST